MKLVRCGEPDRERPGMQLPDGTRVDASECTRDYDEAFFAGDGLDRLRQWLARSGQRAPRLPAVT